MIEKRHALRKLSREELSARLSGVDAQHATTVELWKYDVNRVRDLGSCVRTSPAVDQNTQELLLGPLEEQADAIRRYRIKIRREQWCSQCHPTPVAKNVGDRNPIIRTARDSGLLFPVWYDLAEYSVEHLAGTINGAELFGTLFCRIWDLQGHQKVELRCIREVRTQTCGL